MSKKSKGWKNERYRHSLAARGIKTGRTERQINNPNYNPNMARYGKSNGRWRGGKSKTYYRRIAGCEKNDGKIVHHKDHNKLNSELKNLEVIVGNEFISAKGIHSQQHPEKGYRDRKRAFPRWVNKLRFNNDKDWRHWRFSTYNGKERLTYGEMQRELIRSKPVIVQAYYKGKYYDEIKFRGLD